jgi:hypothetical protein
LNEKKENLFQSHSSQIGRHFANLCRETLRGQGWKLTGPQRTVLGVEIDEVAYTKNGNKVNFEFKGSVNGPIPGLKRFNTYKQAIATAYLVKQFDPSPFVVLTSHKPNSGTLGERAIAVTKEKGLIDKVLGVFDYGDIKKLTDMFKNN